MMLKWGLHAGIYFVRWSHFINGCFSDLEALAVLLQYIDLTEFWNGVFNKGIVLITHCGNLHAAP